MLKAALSQRLDLWIAGFALVYLTVCTAHVLDTLLGHLAAGGHGWNTADWLINADNVHVRRGLFGSVMLRVSDKLSISPVLAVVAFQCALVLMIAAGAFAAVLRAGQGQRALVALLLLSPGFALLFWTNDQHAAIRKEAVTYAAIALLLFTKGGGPRDVAVILVASLLFSLGVAGHILNAVMTPAFLCAVWVVLGTERAGSLPWVIGAGVLLAWAAFNTWYPITFSGIASADPVCQPLLDRGLPKAFCNEAIAVTAADSQDARNFVASMTSGAGVWARFISVYAVLLGLVLLLCAHTSGLRRLAWIAALSLFPILPAYTVGFDWGRQFVMHLTPLILIAGLMLALGQIRQSRAVPLALVAAVIGISLLGGPSHMQGLTESYPFFQLKQWLL